MEATHHFRTDPSEEDGWRGITLSRENPHARIFAAIPGGTKIGPVIEVHVVQVMGTHGLESAVPSKRDHLTTSRVPISRGKNRFVNEVRAPNVSHIVPRAELLSEQASSKDTESCDVTDSRSRVLEANLVNLTAGTIPACERM